MVSRAMEWRNRLVEKGLDEEIADELVVGLPEQFASAADVRRLEGRLAVLERDVASLKEGVIRIDERLGAVERVVVELRQEMRELREEMREELGGMRKEMREEIGGMRQEMREEIGGMRREMGAMRIEIREEMREGMGATREEFQRGLENERTDRRWNTRVLIAAIVLTFAANAAVVTAVVTLLD